MDEVGFGPDREIRRPPRRRRALTAALCVAGAAVVAAGVQHALTKQHPASQSAALPAAPARLPPKGCPPAHPGWPSLAGLPAGLRLSALPVVIDAQFSGRCTAP
jgi:hypothetical protein